MMSFLEINGIKLTCTDEEIVKIGFGIADSTMDERTLLNFIIEYNL